MGLEIATYISGLTASWPTSGEPKSQGDDHLRLLKSVLQSTFPIANAPLYFPKAESASTAQVLDVTDQNNIMNISTASGDVAVTLPAGFDTTKAGWSCEIMKGSADTNGVMVAAASGTITSRVGATATIRVGAYAEPCRFFWTGATWVAVKPGPLIGSTVNWDGAVVPYGYMVLNGVAFNATTFAELNLALGGATLRDKRGRVETGVDEFGFFSGTMGSTLGSVGGVARHQISAAEMYPHNHGMNFNTGNDSPDHAHDATGGEFGGTSNAGVQAGGTYIAPVSAGGESGRITIQGASARHVHNVSGSTDTGAGVAGATHINVQPTIITQKLIRAC